MKSPNLLTATLIAGALCFSPALSADDDTITNNDTKKEDKSFSYFGGSLVLNNLDESNDLGVGVDAVYLRKVLGGFSLGFSGNLSVSHSFPKEEYYAPNQWMPIGSTGKRSQFSHVAGVALLLGAIAEHGSGARSAFYFGPTIGTIGVNYKRKLTYDDGTVDSWNRDESTAHIGLTLGGYYQRPHSKWTYGLNTNLSITTLRSEMASLTSLRLSAGYAF